MRWEDAPTMQEADVHSRLKDPEDPTVAAVPRSRDTLDPVPHRLRIAIFDHRIMPTNPAGSRHRDLLRDMADDYDFTVFAIEFDNPRPDRIRFRRIPVPRRPLVGQYLLFHCAALAIRLSLGIAGRWRYDLVQTADTSVVFAQTHYVHFCNRTFLRQKPFPIRLNSVRNWLQWLNHRCQAAVEPFVFARAHRIVAVSRGLATEIEREYPATRGKIHVIHNGVDVDRMARPDDHDSRILRDSLGLSSEDIVLVFVALGHFERKGLPVLLTALERIPDSRVKLLVVGGSEFSLRTYCARIDSSQLQNRVLFVGNQPDVRPFLWAADAFVLPSFYEAFSLVSLEAAAAALPILVPLLNGVEEFIQDGVNGLTIEPNADNVEATLRWLLALSPEARSELGRNAARSIRAFGIGQQQGAWRDLMKQSLSPQAACGQPE